MSGIPADRRRDRLRDRGQARGLGRWHRDPLDPGGRPASPRGAVHAVDRLDMRRKRLGGIPLIRWSPHRMEKRVGQRAPASSSPDSTSTSDAQS